MIVREKGVLFVTSWEAKSLLDVGRPSAAEATPRAIINYLLSFGFQLYQSRKRARSSRLKSMTSAQIDVLDHVILHISYAALVLLF
jgi:hypothetical protein